MSNPRRSHLSLYLAAPIVTAVLLAGCGTAGDMPTGGSVQATPSVAEPAPPTPAPTPSPVVLPPGRQERALIAGTPQETPLYLIGSGRPGPVVLVLGGVHGDEPGGWLAAERVREIVPGRGTLLVVPRANRHAVEMGLRTTEELGDLNRLYPGDLDGPPMARMAHEIVQVVREFRVDVVVDLHESWGFYKDRPYRSRAFLGQTVSAYPNESGPPLAEAVVDAVNRQILDPQEEFVSREFPPRGLLGMDASDLAEDPAAGLAGGGSRSSLGLGRLFPHLAALLVEKGQQQPLERRADLHVLVVQEVLRQLGML